MECPLFSVLIANYNNGKYLQEAIDSIWQQTYSNWEVIIIDDGSTDNSRLIYERYRNNHKFHIFYNEKNMGCAYTKHQCVLHSSGEICGYLDPDDALLPNAIECCTNLLLSSPNAVLVFSRNYLCDSSLNIIKESRKLVLKDNESYFEHHDYQAENFSAFKRSAYFQMGGIDITNKAGVDADLYFRLEEIGGIVVSKELTYKYRKNSNALTSNWEKMMYWNIIVRHNTCIRRGLSPEKYSYYDYTDFLNLYCKLINSQATQILSSHAYKIGKLILFPIRWLQKIKK